MEQKTKVVAEEGRQDLHITRTFELPRSLVFRAYTEPELLEEWMGTKVLKLDNKKHGGWQFQTSDPKGNVVFSASGTIHEFLPEEKIIRTFEMDNAPFGVQLEILTFEEGTEDESTLHIHIVYESVAHRDKMVQIGFAKGLGMAHNRLQEMGSRVK